MATSTPTASRLSSLRVREICQACAQSHAAPTGNACLSPPCLVSSFVLRRIGAGGAPVRADQQRRT